MSQKLTIDGVDYDTDMLSDTAKNLIFNIRATDQEIARTQALVSMLQTARNTYAQALKPELDKVKSEVAEN